MDTGTAGTFAAALAARDTLAETTRGAGRGGERIAAAAARTAIFQEALLGALRARFAELRTVAR